MCLTILMQTIAKLIRTISDKNYFLKERTLTILYYRSHGGAELVDWNKVKCYMAS